MRININAMRDIRMIYDQLQEDELILGGYDKAFWMDQLIGEIRRLDNYMKLNEVKLPLPLPMPSIMVIEERNQWKRFDRFHSLKVRCRISKEIVKQVELI